MRSLVIGSTVDSFIVDTDAWVNGCVIEGETTIVHNFQQYLFCIKQYCMYIPSTTVSVEVTLVASVVVVLVAIVPAGVYIKVVKKIHKHT